MNRRVLLVSPYSFDIPGGVQQQVDGIATALARAGEAVSVLAPSSAEERIQNGYRFIPAGRAISIPSNGSRAPIAPGPRSLLAVRRAIARVEPSVLHVHEPLVPGPSLFSLYTFDGPVVGTYHRSRAGRIYPIYGHLNVLAQRKVTVSAVVSTAAEATASRALGKHFRNPAVIQNGIDRRAISRWPRLLNPRLVVLFVGRHEPRKGLVVLLEAFVAIAGDVELQIVGDGPETERLQRRYEDPRIVWLGSVGDDEKHRRLASADVFVAPSLGGESFGVVLLEAMAAGTAVIASDLPGYREAGQGVVTYTPPNDPTALRAGIETLLADPELRRRRGESGREMSVRSDFSEIATKYLDLYDRAAELHRQNGLRRARSVD
ncbi:MAG TPA: glycosyltransferase family 4 protein [Acidimicrobiales bacterium]|nr:glycosyltransferase family 4 protein [Acidimicrobiales bacterium]